MAVVAKNVRLIDCQTGRQIGTGEDVPIERYWSEQDDRDFPQVRQHLMSGEILGWNGTIALAFRPESGHGRTERELESHAVRSRVNLR